MSALAVMLLASALVQARPQPQPQGQPTESVPSVTVADFAKSTKMATGQVTKVETDPGKVVTRIVNQTVTTTKTKSSSSKKSGLIGGKLAGIIIGIVIAIIVIIIIAVLIHKWRKRKRERVLAEGAEGTGEAGQEVKEKKLDEEVDNADAQVVPNVPGQVGYASEPAKP